VAEKVPATPSAAKSTKQLPPRLTAIYRRDVYLGLDSGIY